jgi:hypothetical protein
MDSGHLQRRETLLLETILSGLDARESAKAVPSPMLLYLSELLIERARQELERVRLDIEGSRANASAP